MFSGADADVGQPTEFLPGRVNDAFRVTFNGTAFTWTLNGSTATANSNAPLNVCRQKITPVVNAVVEDGSGNFIAYFG
jgi:hypothetical protein